MSNGRRSQHSASSIQIKAAKRGREGAGREGQRESNAQAKLPPVRRQYQEVLRTCDAGSGWHRVGGARLFPFRPVVRIDELSTPDVTMSKPGRWRKWSGTWLVTARCRGQDGAFGIRFQFQKGWFRLQLDVG